MKLNDISCKTSSFDAFTVAAMTHSVLGVSATQTLPVVKDFVSKVVGNFDGVTHCGERVYSIGKVTPSNYANVLSLKTSTNVITLGLPSTTMADVGDYTI